MPNVPLLPIPQSPMNPDFDSSPPPPDVWPGRFPRRDRHSGGFGRSRASCRPMDAAAKRIDGFSASPDLAEAQQPGQRAEGSGPAGRCANHYQVAARLKPACVEAHNNLGNICKRQRKFDEAVDATAGLATRPNPGEVHNSLWCCAAEGNLSKETGHLERAVAMQPHDAIRNELGGPARDDGGSTRLGPFFDQAIALQTPAAEAH